MSSLVDLIEPNRKRSIATLRIGRLKIDQKRREDEFKNVKLFMTRPLMTNPRSLKIFLLFIFSGLLGFDPSVSFAHIRNYSFSDVSIKNKLVSYELRMTINDLNHIVSMDLNEDSIVDQNEFENSRKIIDEGLAPWVDDHVRVSNNKSICNSRYRGYELVENNEVLIKMLYKCESPAEDLEIVATIFKEIDAKHMNMAKIHYKDEMRENIFREGKETFSLLNFKKEQSAALVYDLKEFWNIGLETGFRQTNYILLTLALVLVGNSLIVSFRNIALFFSGHVLALIATVFAGIKVPDIALNTLTSLTIVYLCAENCFKKEGKSRFVFAILLGAASASGFTVFFTDLAIPKEKLAQTLFSYSAGVTSGQVILTLFIFLFSSYALSFNWKRKVVQVTSFYTGLLSFYLFLEKVLKNVF